MSSRQGSLQISDYIVRSKKHGCFKIYKSRDWGKYLVPISDPNGADVTPEEVNGMKLIDPFPRLPKDLWARYIALCFYMCPSGKLDTRFHDSQYEVQVCLLRDNATRTKWKIVVPKQTVSGVSVKSVLANNVDIETGEKYTQFPPEGWVHAGSSHSHNTMQAFFSSTDDKSELTVPGLHIVVGNIDHKKNEYSYKASIVAQKIRKEIEIEDVVDIEPEDLPFHKNILEYITPLVTANKKLYKLYNKKGQKLNSHQGAWLSGTSGGDDWLEMMGIRIPTKSDSSDIVTPQGLVSKATSEAAGAIIKDCSTPLLIDENGDPTPFFNSLDKTNSDLFDDPELEELYRNTAYDEEIANQISEWMEEGIPVEVLYRTLDYQTGGRPEEYSDLLKEEGDK